MKRGVWVRLFEACLGIAIGAAVAVPLELGVMTVSRQSRAGEMAKRVCPPVGQPAGPGLDGDRSFVDGKWLVCDGSNGQWVRPAERAQKIRQQIIATPWVTP